MRVKLQLLAEAPK